MSEKVITTDEFVKNAKHLYRTARRQLLRSFMTQ